MKKEFIVAATGGVLLGQRHFLLLLPSVGPTLFSSFESESYHLPWIVIQNPFKQEETFRFVFYDSYSSGRSSLLQTHVPRLDALWVYVSLSRAFEAQEHLLFGDPDFKEEKGALAALASCHKRNPLPVVFQFVEQEEPPSLDYKAHFLALFARSFPFPLLPFERHVVYDHAFLGTEVWEEKYREPWHRCQRESFLWTLRQLRSEPNDAG